jgi:hypothetical protein
MKEIFVNIIVLTLSVLTNVNVQMATHSIMMVKVAMILMNVKKIQTYAEEEIVHKLREI